MSLQLSACGLGSSIASSLRRLLTVNDKLEEVNLDFQVLGPAPNNPDEVEVLIAAARKEKIDIAVAQVIFI